MAVKMEDLVRARHRQLTQSGVDPSEAIEALIAEVADSYSKAGGTNMAEVEKFGAGVREYFGGLSAEELAAEPQMELPESSKAGSPKAPKAQQAISPFDIISSAAASGLMTIKPVQPDGVQGPAGAPEPTRTLPPGVLSAQGPGAPIAASDATSAPGMVDPRQVQAFDGTGATARPVGPGAPMPGADPRMQYAQEVPPSWAVPNVGPGAAQGGVGSPGAPIGPAAPSGRPPMPMVPPGAPMQPQDPRMAMQGPVGPGAPMAPMGAPGAQAPIGPEQPPEPGLWDRVVGGVRSADQALGGYIRDDLQRRESENPKLLPMSTGVTDTMDRVDRSLAGMIAKQYTKEGPEVIRAQDGQLPPPPVPPQSSPAILSGAAGRVQGRGGPSPLAMPPAPQQPPQPNAPPLAMPPQGGAPWSDQIEQDAYGRVWSGIGGVLASPFKAAAGVVGDTMQGAQDLGRDLGYKAAGLEPRRPPQPALAQEPVQPPPAALEQPQAAPVAPQATPMQEAISGSPLTANPTANPTAPVYIRGAPSALYESGGRYDAINPNDTGGSAYGRNQIHSKNMPEFTSKYAPGVFDGLTPGTDAFDRRWEEWSVTAAGKEAQHRYIDDTHFMPFNETLKSNLGLDATARSPAIEELAYSTSVQFGPSNKVFEKALAGRDVASMSDAEILDAVTQYKIDNVDTLFQSTPASKRPGLVKRFHDERGTLGQYLDAPRPEGGTPMGGQGGGSPMGGTAPGGQGILSQGGPAGQSGPFGPPQAQEGILAQGYPKSRADEFMERIYSSPWKGALYNALAAIADVNPYAHVEMLRQMDADDREEFKMYQELHAPMDPLKRAQIAEIEYKMQQGPSQEYQSVTFNKDTGTWEAFTKGGQAQSIPTPNQEYRTPGEIKAAEATVAAQKEAALQGAEFDTNLQQLQDIMDVADQNGLFGAWPNNPVSKTVDYFGEQAPFNSKGAALRNEWRKSVDLAASNDTLTRLSMIGGSDTEREFLWMREMSPKITSNKSDFVAYMKMMQLAREKIRVREAGGLDEAARARFDTEREAIIKAAKMDSYLTE